MLGCFITFSDLPHELDLHAEAWQKVDDVANNLALGTDLLDQNALIMRSADQRIIVVNAQLHRMPERLCSRIEVNCAKQPFFDAIGDDVDMLAPLIP